MYLWPPNLAQRIFSLFCEMKFYSHIGMTGALGVKKQSCSESLETHFGFEIFEIWQKKNWLLLVTILVNLRSEVYIYKRSFVIYSSNVSINMLQIFT